MKDKIACLVHGLAAAAAVVALGCSGHTAGIGDGTSGGTSGTSGGTTPGGTSSGGTSGGTHASGSEALFQAPTGQATPDSIYGVWGGTKKDNGITFDSRLKLSKDSATIATRCTLDSSGKVSGIVGVTAAARITEESLVILESKTDEKDDGVVRCSVNAAPKEVKVCSADVTKGFERNCFRVEGTQFTDYGETSFDTVQLTKLSD